MNIIKYLESCMCVCVYIKKKYIDKLYIYMLILITINNIFYIYKWM